MGTRNKQQSLVPLFVFLCKANTLALLIGIALFDPKLFRHLEKTPGSTSLINTSPESRDEANMGDSSGDCIAAIGGREAESGTTKATTPKDWFADCTIKKNMLLPKLYILEGGVARRFTPSEYESWKPEFVSWSNSAKLPGLIQMSKQIVMLDDNNKPQGPINDSTQLSNIGTSTTLQKHVLKIVSDHAGRRLGMLDNAAINALSDKEINFQFRGFEQVLSEVFLYLNASCNVTGSAEHIYPELRPSLGNITMLDDCCPHPLSTYLALAWIDKQISVHPCCTGMAQRETLKKELITLQQDTSINLHNIKTQLDHLKHSVITIQARDPLQSHATNESAQAKFSILMKVVCRRIKRESRNERLITAAEIIRSYINNLERTPTKESIHDFHVTISTMLNKHVPPPDPQDNKERPHKRGRMESADLLALLVQGMSTSLSKCLRTPETMTC
jgi:hypothetical protein